MADSVLLTSPSEAVERLIAAALQGQGIDRVTGDPFPRVGDQDGFPPNRVIILDMRHNITEGRTLLERLRQKEGIGDLPTLFIRDNPRLLYHRHVLREHDACVTGDGEAPEPGCRGARGGRRHRPPGGRRCPTPI